LKYFAAYTMPSAIVRNPSRARYAARTPTIYATGDVMPAMNTVAMLASKDLKDSFAVPKGQSKQDYDRKSL